MKKYTVRQVRNLDFFKQLKTIRTVTLAVDFVLIVILVLSKSWLLKGILLGALVVILGISAYLINKAVEKSSDKVTEMHFQGDELKLLIRKKDASGSWEKKEVLLNTDNFYNLEISSEKQAVRLTWKEENQQVSESFSVKGLKNKNACITDLKIFAEGTMEKQGYKRK